MDDFKFHVLEIAPQYMGKYKIRREEKIFFLRGTVEQGVILKKDAYLKALYKLRETFSASKYSAVLALNGKVVINRFVKMPVMTEEEIASTLKWDIEKYLPVNSETGICVEHVLVSGHGSTVAEQNLMLVAVERSYIEDIYDYFSQVNIELLGVETTSLSVIRLLAYKKEPEQNYISLHFQKQGTHFTVIYDGELMFYRYIANGVDGSSIFSAEESDAEIQEGLTEDDVVDQMQNKYQPLIDELKASRDYFYNEYKNKELETIFITGELASKDAFLSLWEKNFELPVQRPQLNINSLPIKIKNNGFFSQFDAENLVLLGMLQRKLWEI